MDRKEFLVLAQKCSLLESEIHGIKKNVPQEFLVEHNGIAYYPYACMIRFDDEGKVINTAILHALQSNSIETVQMERVKKYEQG